MQPFRRTTHTITQCYAIFRSDTNWPVGGSVTEDTNIPGVPYTSIAIDRSIAKVDHMTSISITFFFRLTYSTANLTSDL